MSGDELLVVDGLGVELDGVPVVRGLSWTVQRKETLAIVGESGAGKSQAALAVLGLSPEGAKVTGSARFLGEELIGTSAVRRLWGRRLSMVAQDGPAALSPVHSVGAQLVTALRSVHRIGRREAWQRAVVALDRMGIADSARRVHARPHEFSGGMRQRAALAVALAGEPDLLFADEPTTALDATVQAHVLELLAGLDTALVLITHDLGTVASLADRVLVMRDGAEVENGAVEEVFTHPRMPYTKELLAAEQYRIPAEPAAPAPLLRVHDLHVRYGKVQAVRGVTLEVSAGETLGVVGESGCGKSSLATAILRLRRADSGTVTFTTAGGSDVELTGLDEAALRPLRRELQPVFQDPYTSLSPRLRIADTIAEPLRVQGLPVEGRVDELLAMVGLEPGHGTRRPHQLSGGQRQRVGLARALAGEPRLLILDEPVSALDATVQAGIVDLLASLQDRLGLGYLFISHDLAVVRRLAHRICVMYLGQIVEEGTADAVYRDPSHPYTRALIDAIPTRDPATGPPRTVPAGEPPNPADPPSGCSFRSRCPRARAVCARTAPLPIPAAHGGTVTCHFPLDHDPAPRWVLR
jgi:peptide/nickel transport system ATP-binding protein